MLRPPGGDAREAGRCGIPRNDGPANVRSGTGQSEVHHVVLGGECANRALEPKAEEVQGVWDPIRMECSQWSADEFSPYGREGCREVASGPMASSISQVEQSEVHYGRSVAKEDENDCAVTRVGPRVVDPIEEQGTTYGQ